MKIADIRAKFPEYADVPDRELVRGLHKTHYADLPYTEFLKSIDFNERADPTAEMGTGKRLLAGIGKGMTDLAVGAGQRLGMVDQKTVDERSERDAPLMNTTAGTVGNITGKVAASLPAMFIPGANTVAGSALIGGGMGLAEPTKTGESAAGNAVMGAAGGTLGQVAGSALARALRPVQSSLPPQQAALAQAAQQRGIPLDAADLTGSRPLTIMRDVMANLPLTADRQVAIQGAKQTAFNRAVSGTYGGVDDALTPQALQAARDRLGKDFTDLSSRNVANVDNAALQKFSNVIDEANRYNTPDVARIIQNHADDILSRVDQSNQLPGQAYRALDSQMGRQMRSSANGDVRNYVGRLRDALRETMDASIAPADQAAWKQARSQYANLMRVAPLAARDEAGDVSGRALLSTALRGNGNAAFSGGGEMGELGRIGKAFIAEQTPNSGTAQRGFYQRFLESPVSTTLSGAVGGISLPVQAAMNSKVGQRYLTTGVANLSESQKKTLNALLRGSGTAVLADSQ